MEMRVAPICHKAVSPPVPDDDAGLPFNDPFS